MVALMSLGRFFTLKEQLFLITPAKICSNSLRDGSIKEEIAIEIIVTVNCMAHSSCSEMKKNASTLNSSDAVYTVDYVSCLVCYFKKYLKNSKSYEKGIEYTSL